MDHERKLSRSDFLREGLRPSGQGLGDVISALFGWGRGSAQQAPRVMRPPGALPEAEFLAACTRCDACAGACPAQAIRIANRLPGVPDGTPFMYDLLAAPCALCPDTPCIRACEPEALVATAPGDIRLGLAVVDEGRCLAHHGEACQACVEACPLGTQAIVSHQGRPIVVPLGCAGCGACLAACPAEPSALSVTTTA